MLLARWKCVKIAETSEYHVRFHCQFKGILPFFQQDEAQLQHLRVMKHKYIKWYRCYVVGLVPYLSLVGLLKLYGWILVLFF